MDKILLWFGYSSTA